MSTQENKEEVIINENLPPEIIENEQTEISGEIPEGDEKEEPEEDSTDGGESEDEDSSVAQAEEQEKTIDDLEIPEPDLKELTPADYKAIRQEKQRKREEQRAQELREEAFRREQDILIQAKAEQVALTMAAMPPNRDDFEDDASYYAALHNHTVAKEEIKRRIVADEKSFVESRIKLSNGIAETLKKGSERYSDFEEVVGYVFKPGSDVPGNTELAEAINESKYGADILYMLAKNKKKMIEVAGMTPRTALRWLWEMEQKIETVRKRKKENSITVNSAKPKPMAKVQSKLASHKDIGSMSTKEYTEYWKNKQRNA